MGFVTYAHKDAPNGARFRDAKGTKLPEWAVDIKDDYPQGMISEVAATTYTLSIVCEDCHNKTDVGIAQDWFRNDQNLFVECSHCDAVMRTERQWVVNAVSNMYDS